MSIIDRITGVFSSSKEAVEKAPAKKAAPKKAAAEKPSSAKASAAKKAGAAPAMTAPSKNSTSKVNLVSPNRRLGRSDGAMKQKTSASAGLIVMGP